MTTDKSGPAAGWWDTVSRTLFEGMRARFVVGAKPVVSGSPSVGKPGTAEREKTQVRVSLPEQDERGV